MTIGTRTQRSGLLVLLAPPMLLAMFVTCSCGGNPSEPVAATVTDASTDVAPSSDDDAQADAPIMAPLDAPACDASSLPLVVTMQSTSLGAAPFELFVPTTYAGTASVFLIDTGSPTTFAHEPLADGGTTSPNDLTPDAGAVTLGCDTFDLMGIGVAPSPPVDGKPCNGTLGDDRLLAAPTKLDLAGSRILFHSPGAPFEEAAAWPTIPFDRPLGYLRVHGIELDGTPVNLLLDTGSSDTLWLGQGPQPGDMEVDGEDAEGNIIKMYLGTVQLSLGAYKETVPVYRVPSFPYLQQLVNQLGGDISGLFGLSSFSRGVVFDTDAQEVRVAP